MIDVPVYSMSCFLVGAVGLGCGPVGGRPALEDLFEVVVGGGNSHLFALVDNVLSGEVVGEELEDGVVDIFGVAVDGLVLRSAVDVCAPVIEHGTPGILGASYSSVTAGFHGESFFGACAANGSE